MIKIEKSFYDGYVYDLSMKNNSNFFADSICIHNCEKKRYLMQIHDNEGVRFETPKLKIMGVEAIKSSTPAPCRVAMKELFKIILNEDEKSMQKYVLTFKDTFYKLPPEEKAFPRSVSNITKYEDSKTIYKNSPPINSRAAILYNHLLKKHKLEGKYEKISNGNKMRYIYLNPRNPLREDVIGFIDKLPVEFGLHQYIDNEKQFYKSFIKPVEMVLNAIDWDIEEKTTLDSFFTF